VCGLCVCVCVCGPTTMSTRVIVVGFYYPFYILKLFLGKKRGEKRSFFMGSLKSFRVFYFRTLVYPCTCVRASRIAYILYRYIRAVVLFLYFPGYRVHNIMRPVRYLTYCISPTYPYIYIYIYIPTPPIYIHNIICCNKRVCTFSFENAFRTIIINENKTLLTTVISKTKRTT